MEKVVPKRNGRRLRIDNNNVPLGAYISVPFCRTKCSYCNFASGVFPATMYARYQEKLCVEIERAPQTAAEMGGEFEPYLDSIYLGGGTPTVLGAELKRIFTSVRNMFDVAADAEITVECAPGTLSDSVLETLLDCGVNRVSLGVQSFVDEETRAVARLHTRDATLDDITRLRAAGITNLNVDLLAGLPHQTRESWRFSLQETIATVAPHVSVYMLEVDKDSRLGRELIAGGARYHAHSVPDEDLTAELYLEAIETFSAAGISQYEISNFARRGRESRHNLKYWTRQPYLGFGIDAHSMLPASPAVEGVDAVRFATPDSLEQYLEGAPLERTPVSRRQAREESFFLGLRLTCGVDVAKIAARYGLDGLEDAIDTLCKDGLLEREQDVIRLTTRGRLLSNEVFERFVG